MLIEDPDEPKSEIARLRGFGIELRPLGLARFGKKQVVEIRLVARAKSRLGNMESKRSLVLHAPLRSVIGFMSLVLNRDAPESNFPDLSSDQPADPRRKRIQHLASDLGILSPRAGRHMKGMIGILEQLQRSASAKTFHHGLEFA